MGVYLGYGLAHYADFTDQTCADLGTLHFGAAAI
jgi:hypothetical protein